ASSPFPDCSERRFPHVRQAPSPRSIFVTRATAPSGRSLCPPSGAAGGPLPALGRRLGPHVRHGGQGAHGLPRRPCRGHWPGVVDAAAGRAAAAQGFVSWHEAYRRVVDDDYATYLGRPADAAGETAWLSALESARLSVGEVAEAFLASDEYFARGGGPG